MVVEWPMLDLSGTVITAIGEDMDLQPNLKAGNYFGFLSANLFFAANRFH